MCSSVQFHKMNMRVMCSVHKVLTYFFFLSIPFSIFLFEYLISPFSLNIFSLSLVLSCHLDRCTRIRIGESQVNTFGILADKEALIIKLK